jgi:phage-related protein
MEGPLVDWLAALPSMASEVHGRLDASRRWVTNCADQVDYLCDGIYEVRTKHRGVNYRMLYFFHGRTAAVVSHGIAKQQAAVPPKEIEKAVQRKIAFETHPQRHTFTPPEE